MNQDLIMCKPSLDQDYYRAIQGLTGSKPGLNWVENSQV